MPEPTHGRHDALSAQTLERARRLRSGQTDEENRLWYFLRARRFGGWKFRRQEPIGKCYVDFCCVEKKLIIELDGGQHGEASQAMYDARRDEELRRMGFSVLRFWDHDVLKRTDVVLQVIWDALGGGGRGNCGVIER